ncbi:MAG: biotin/lipoyl-binding protein [Bacteroidales bacterium]|nr:biotin/lipoyl-binding protein [Bacteroidales bacterium]
MKTYRFKINGNDYEVTVNTVEGGVADVTVNGTPYKVEMENAPAAAAAVQTAPAVPVKQTVAPVQAAPAPAAGAGKSLTSPLPGVIVSVNVNVGDVVKAGQTVAVLEAMKMENDIQAECDGTVTAVKVAKGDSVLEGAVIVTIG